MNITIPGEPKGKGRHRTTKQGITYTPETTASYENLVKVLYMQEHQTKLKGELEARIMAYMTIPKSTSKVKRQKMLDGAIRPTKKVDVDNIAKIILDALNGLAYDDDKQIVSLRVEKYYSNEPSVEIEIEQILNKIS